MENTLRKSTPLVLYRSRSLSLFYKSAFSYYSGFGVLVLYFILFRLGTFRTLVIGPLDGTGEISLFGKYNHKETDELVFQFLVQAVGKDFWDYSLHNKQILHILGLAQENYNDAIFM